MINQIEPWIDEAELRELQRVIASTFVVEHDLTKEFEQMTQNLTGARHAIAMCNGTMALFACLKAAGIEAGDEVIVPDITFVASANAVILAGGTPVLCEICEDTFGIDVAKADKLISPNTKAIMPVHLYGQSADMTAVDAFARKHGLKVIEDAAQGVDVKFEGRHVGTFGEMGVLSYYGNKTVTCGEGGMILTNDDELAKIVYRLKNHGRDVKGTFVHDHIGFNLSFTEMQAAVGIAQMKKLPRIVERKRQIYERYVAGLRGIARFRPVYMDPRCQPVFWFTSFLSDDIDALTAFLRERDIQTRRFFYPLHLQPCYLSTNIVKNINDDFSISEKVFQRGLSLPSSYNLTDEQQTHVIETIQEFYAHRH